MEEFPKYRSTDWGFDQTHCLNKDDITIKTLVLFKNQQTSLQRHHDRSELWFPLNKTKIAKNGREILCNYGNVTLIPKRVMHRLIGYDDASIVIEVSYGKFDENDIERFHDIYGRV